jgi:hypothetical protein
MHAVIVCIFSLLFDSGSREGHGRCEVRIIDCIRRKIILLDDRAYGSAQSTAMHTIPRTFPVFLST